VDRLRPVTGDDVLLALLVAVVSGTEASPVKVLDFGGGMGVSYALTRASLLGVGSLQYHVVENPKLCEAGAALFANDARIHFHRDIPPDLAGVDVVYVNSVLQYIEDYRGLLRRLCALGPRFVLLARCSAGKVQTYATAQVTLPGKRIPYWFLGVDELVSILRESGYRPVFMARGGYPVLQPNFDEGHRIGSASNLLFARLPTA